MKAGILVASILTVSIFQWSTLSAQSTNLFNGKNMEGWTFAVEKDDPIQQKDKIWNVDDGLLSSTGLANSEIRTEAEFENYVLTLDWRYMKPRKNGISASGSGTIFIHRGDEKNAFGEPQSVEISLRDVGAVYLRGIDHRKNDQWAFRAPKFADKIEKDMGKWNSLKIICNGKKLTVIQNGVPVSHLESLHRTKGSVVLKSTRGFVAAPTFYRNLVVTPIKDADIKTSVAAATKLAEMKKAIERKNAAEEKQRMESEAKEKAAANAFGDEWKNNPTEPSIEFKADARLLPFPKDMSKLSFNKTFKTVKLFSPSKLNSVADFYKTEMAKRGWKVVDAERDDDSIEVDFKNGKAKVELELDQRSKGVEISFRCKGLSFDGTDNPAELAKLGIPQPKAYVYLQNAIPLPDSHTGLEFRGEDEMLFKSKVELLQSFDDIGKQLKAQGFTQSRRPLISGNRRYTEYRKGSIVIKVNLFVNGKGSRAILTYQDGK